jgi:hypothetical protein
MYDGSYEEWSQAKQTVIRGNSQSNLANHDSPLNSLSKQVSNRMANQVDLVAPKFHEFPHDGTEAGGFSAPGSKRFPGSFMTQARAILAVRCISSPKTACSWQIDFKALTLM